MRTPKWERDELILALDVFFRHYPKHISKSHPDVIELSEILNRLPIHSSKPDEKAFRNQNSVYMKLSNFLRLDPNYTGKGLERGGRLEEEIWKEFSNNVELLSKVAQSIRVGIEYIDDNRTMEDDDEFREGKILYRVHKTHERNSNITKKAKNLAEKNGNLKCQVCGFDFYENYGELGKGYIECHHTIPVSQYSADQKTSIEDLVLVCSNCHRMLHRKRPWISENQLKSILRED